MTDRPIRGRFAPTPSGRMHLGNVFCALMAWLSAKSVGGEVVLRIEDLDRSRCRPEYTEVLLDDLAYLGLRFDHTESALVKQSERTALYEACLEFLIKKQMVYPCYCSRDELHAPNAPHASDGRVLYGGTCRNLTDAQRAGRSRPPAYRMKAASKDIVLEDTLYGFQRYNVATEWGDFIVRRSDGLFAYQLAVVADDIDMDITQVVRGRDLLTATAPQLQLYDVFAQEPPLYAHVPMLLAPDGRRLSKRDKDLDMGELRARYTAPEVLIGRLLWLAGVLDQDEPLSVQEAATVFSWDKMRKQDIIIRENVF